jgi:hypothetical protein
LPERPQTYAVATMTTILSRRRLPFALLVSVLVVGLAPASRMTAAQPRIKIGHHTDDVEKARTYGFDHAELLGSGECGP